MNTVSSYVRKYSDEETYTSWLNEHITKTCRPPVCFSADGIASDCLKWEKTAEKPTAFVDFPEEAPFRRLTQNVRYVCAERGLQVTLTLTTYPGYPVVEYDCTLENIGEGLSCRLSDLQSIHTEIDVQEGYRVLHATRGSIFGATLTAGTDFAPLTYTSFGDGGIELADTTGRPSETYIPYFNLENPGNNTGTVAILNWQGCWKARFAEEGRNIVFSGGQYETDFVLQKGESARFPGVVLLFYKGGFMNGQNVYRRWIYQCNLFREQGKHMKSTNVLNCAAATCAEKDITQIQLLCDAGVAAYFDKFNVDAGDGEHGWYPTEGHDWYYTGNWFPDPKYYPNGLLPVSEAAHKAGMQFALWFEPERLFKGTKTSRDLADCIIGLNTNGEALSGDEIPDGSLCLVNYARPKAVAAMTDLLDRSFTAYGVDQYRQDFNIQPAPYWSAFDLREGKERGIPRVGLTENHACTGYLTLWKNLLKRHPAMYFDACASGGARYDLSTMRFSFLHTRSDEWFHDEDAQCQSYGSAMWFLYCGSGFGSHTVYSARSHMSNSIGCGLYDASDAEDLKKTITAWKDLAAYLFFDYYPLTPYAGKSNRTMCMQYDSPEAGKGMLIAFFRQKDSITVRLQGLAPKALYRIRNADEGECSEKVLTGSQLAAGFPLTAEAHTALFYTYCTEEGQNTDDFQSEPVATGRASADFLPSEGQNPSKIPIPIPAVSAAYLPSGMDDTALCAAYRIEGDDKLAFVGYDCTSSGSIYAVSRNVFAELPRNGFVLPDGWEAIDCRAVEIQPKAGWYFLSHWDGMKFRQQPYVKDVNGRYFLWMTNTTGLSDPDGGWQDWDVFIRWKTADGTKKTSLPFCIHCEREKAERIRFCAYARGSTSDFIYHTDEAVFGSLPYTGMGVERDGALWREVDMQKCGYIRTDGRKAPDERESLAGQMRRFGNADAAKLYTRQEGDDTFLYFENAANQSGRITLAWLNADGDVCAQSFLLNV